MKLTRYLLLENLGRDNNNNKGLFTQQITLNKGQNKVKYRYNVNYNIYNQIKAKRAIT